MLPHYSARSFFRQAPRDLLARYFESRGLSFKPDVATVADTRPDPLYRAWLQFSEEQRNEMEIDFREIFRMSCRKGVQAILDATQARRDDTPERAAAFIESLSRMPDHCHRAMATWLDHRGCWREASRFYGGDAPGWWRKRKNMGHRTAATDAASLRRLADLIGTWFHLSEGRGSHCVVESFHRDGLDFYFAYPEDYSRLKMEWADGELVGRRRRPAFEVVFVYSQREGSVDLSFPGPCRAVEPLQQMFAKAILGLDRPASDPADAPVYDLTPLLRKNFDFVYGSGSGVESVTVRKLGLASRILKDFRFTLEPGDAGRPDAIRDYLRMAGVFDPSLLYRVTQAELVACVSADGKTPSGRVPIWLTVPASCSLGYGDRELKLREMVKASGLEPEGIEQDRNRSPETVLIDLGARLCISPNRNLRIDSRELARCAGKAVKALKAQNILRKARPARSTVCPGCERHCRMPVHREAKAPRQATGMKGPATPFILCDKRADINRVPVSTDRLTHWQTDADSLVRFIAGALSLSESGQRPPERKELKAGLVCGKSRRRVVGLRMEEELKFVAGSSELPFAEVLRFCEERYGLEERIIRRWLEGATEEEAPDSASRIRYESRKLDTRKKNLALQKAYRSLKRERPGRPDVWYARQIAKRGFGGGLSAETIRKRMKK